MKHGEDYKYPHHFEDGYVPQEYLPRHLQGKTFYEPTERGFEKISKNVSTTSMNERKRTVNL